MSLPKPIKLTQVSADDYKGLPPKSFVVVGDMPGGGEAVEVAWGDVTGKPTSFPPSTHTHTVANVTGLQAIIDDLTTRIEALEALQA